MTWRRKMWPFEIETDGRRDIHLDNFHRFLEQKEREYPCPLGKKRYLINLIFPRDEIYEIPLGWNPHVTVNPNLPAHWIHGYETNYSTIFDVYPAHTTTEPPGDSCAIMVEDNHEDPWGEPIQLATTASHMLDEHSNRFAFFRGKWWLIWILEERRPLAPWREMVYPTFTFIELDMAWIPGYYPPSESEVHDWMREGF